MDKPYNSAVNKKRTNPHKNVKKEPRSLHQYIINNVQFVLGYIQEEYLKECLMTMGDRWSEDMVDDLFHGAPIKEGFFDYIEFTRMLKHGSKEKDDEVPSLPPEELQGFKQLKVDK